jgi:hypothetical protein
MKVIWTLKNSPRPHIHDKATEFPHKRAFNQRKFIKRRGNALSSGGASRILAGLQMKRAGRAQRRQRLGFPIIQEEPLPRDKHTKTV